MQVKRGSGFVVTQDACEYDPHPLQRVVAGTSSPNLAHWETLLVSIHGTKHITQAIGTFADGQLNQRPTMASVSAGDVLKLSQLAFRLWEYGFSKCKDASKSSITEPIMLSTPKSPLSTLYC